MNKMLFSGLTALLLLPALALASDDVAALKAQLEALKKNYEQRISELEQRLEQLEQTSQEVEPVPVSSGSSQKQNAFNPGISLILDGRYAWHQKDVGRYVLAGFMPGEEGNVGEAGLGIGESEITLSANVDDKFYGQATIAFSDEEVAVEEAYLQALALPQGWGLKFGRFLSALGYLNSQHAHAWDFADAPLIYRGLFSDQLRDDGVQINYLPATPIYLNLGGEILAGHSHPAGGAGNAVGGWTFFAKSGGDIGYESSWQLGLSLHGGHPRDWFWTEGPEGGLLFAGRSRTRAVDLVYKWAPDGNVRQQQFKLQMEYLSRSLHGVLEHEGSEYALNQAKQSGGYVQAYYQWQPQWAAAVRYDRAHSDANAEFAQTYVPADLTTERFSAMVQWMPSEFSRLRLQYNRNQNAQSENADELILQYTHSLGSHGAHSY